MGLGVILALGITSTMVGCSGESASATSSENGGISPRQFVDSVHAVMMADRTVYAKHVVTRLKKQEAPVTPDEYWQDIDHTIPLPAQMFRMGAELVSENPEAGFSYALKSKWPLNPQNEAKSEIEIKGLDYVAENEGENFYGEETIADQKYFVAVYPDRAVAEACWDCHNNHSNRKESYPEFVEGDVMGGVVVRVPVN